MAYSVVYKSNKNYSNFTSNINESPYLNWLKEKPTSKVIFSYNNNYGPEIFKHLHFIPDLYDHTGILNYRYNGEYTDYYIYAKVLIDIDNKKLYLYNCIMDFNHVRFSGNDTKFIGGIKAFKNLKCYNEIIDNMTKLFFGEEWHCYSRYKKKNYVKDKKKSLKMLKSLTYLPHDIHEYIANIMVKWKDITKITLEEYKLLINKIDENIGASVNQYSNLYPWGCVIGVYNFE
jgi:hypothetical protein